MPVFHISLFLFSFVRLSFCKGYFKTIFLFTFTNSNNKKVSVFLKNLIYFLNIKQKSNTEFNPLDFKLFLYFYFSYLFTYIHFILMFRLKIIFYLYLKKYF